MHRGIIAPLLLVVVFLAGIGVAVLYFQSQSKPTFQLPSPSPSPQLTQSSPAADDETANWKTYTGKHFSFQYPSNWYLTDCNIPDNIFLSDIDQSCDTEPGAFPISIFKVLSQDGSFTFERNIGYSVKEKKVVLDRREFLQAELHKENETGLGPSSIIDTRIKLKDFNYDFVLNEVSKINIYTQILSTFKFL